MKKYTLVFISLFIFLFDLNAQIEQSSDNLFFAKEFSKEISIFRAKTFLIENVLNSNVDGTQFEVIPLAAANSGELTTLLYRCSSQNKEGLILGFYGNYWNESGVTYQGFKFKNMPTVKAFQFLEKIEEQINKNESYLREKSDSNNVTFRFDDMIVLLYSSDFAYKIRIYWDGFDATWEQTAYKRTRKRFDRKIKNKS